MAFSPPMLQSLDHAIVAVRDLTAAARTYTALLGRSPSWRGEHPGLGTNNVLYRLGFAPSRGSARQLIRHKHVLVDGGVCDIPSRQVRVGQTVAIRPKSHNIPQIVDAIKDNAKRDRLPFVDADEKKLSGSLLSEPQLSDLPIPIQENLIVELYSK